MTPAPRRWLPDDPLPPYAFVPGRRPHPTRHADGHRCVHPAPSGPVDVTEWRSIPAYVRGIDLFNHGFYWEAHESWEGLWHALGRRGPAADLLVALIRLAAAGIKLREPVPHAVRSHAEKAVVLLAGVEAAIAPEQALMGVRPGGLRQLAEAVRDGRAGRSVSPDADVEVVFPFVVWPG